MENFRAYLPVKYFYSSQHRNTIGKKTKQNTACSLLLETMTLTFFSITAHSNDDPSQGVQSTVKHAIKLHLLLGAKCLFLTL